MSSEPNIYNNFPPEPPQEVLNIINPNELVNNDILEQPEENSFRLPEEQRPEEELINGQFLYIQEKDSRQMLVSAWNAITSLNLWNYMKKHVNNFMLNNDYEGMLNNDYEVKTIYRKIEELGYTGHSGFSFSWTLRQMQYIAQYGEKKYMREVVNI